MHSRSMGYSSLASQALPASLLLVAFVVELVNHTHSPYLITHTFLSSLSSLAIIATGKFQNTQPMIVITAVRSHHNTLVVEDQTSVPVPIQYQTNSEEYLPRGLFALLLESGGFVSSSVL